MRRMNQLRQIIPDRPVDVLLVEDNPADARLMTETLKDAGADMFRVTRVTRLAEAIASAVAAPPDVVLLDLSLPDSSGIATVRSLRSAAPDVAVVVLTGLQDERVGLEAVREGVQDYLVKGQLDGDRAARAIRYAVERTRVEKALRDRDQRLRVIVDSAADGILTFDDQGVIESVNPAALRLFGYASAEMLGADIQSMIPGVLVSAESIEPGEISPGKSHERELMGIRKDGSTFPVSASEGTFRLGARKMSTLIVHDITARRQLEREVLAATGTEQQRIGRELHDGLCQQLLGIALGTEMLARRLKDRERRRLRSRERWRNTSATG
jgi:PAS domain S-box-containing protein